MHRIILFYRDESGATAIEYALLAIMVGIVAIGGLTSFSTAVSNKFLLIATSVSSAS